MRRPPWWEGRGPLALALAPLGALYAAATAPRLRRGGRACVGVPVICVGNLDAGGAGKTPTVLALAERLRARGVAVHALLRGHGGSLPGPARVAGQTAAEVGDEALLLAGLLPTWVARDRLAGARAAVAAGAEALLLDDGFQDPALRHDLALVVVDAARGWGNGLAIPAGPLREGVAAGLSRADLLLTLGDAAAQARFDARWGGGVTVPRLRGEVRPLPTGMPWAGLRALAFAGIGRPEKAFATMRSLGLDLVETVALADHQPLPPALLRRLGARAGALGAQLVTTEKDAARLPPEWRARVLTVPVRLEVEDWAPLDARLDALGL